MDFHVNLDEHLLSTTKHMYNPKHVIGKGATSLVFHGIHKQTGEVRALKIPKFSNFKEINREVEALVVLKHEHIVKFFGVENEAVGGQTVVVMELCDGGSLHAFLHEPENIKGLEDTEFLRLFFGLSSGLKYLQRKGFLHRDLKPGNILRSIGEDNFYIYKLSDFGSSRQVHENGNFQSLAGTEEYLHPAMYKKAFVDRNTPAIFNSSVDRWSLGATLAHACTGDIPFQPFEGVRGNRNVMYFMISQKPPGSIGGVQKHENGEIQWRYAIPYDTTMSEGLKYLMKPILCGLMEKDPGRQWNFPTFFREVKIIKTKRKFHIFNSDMGQYMQAYIDPESRLPALKDEVARQTGLHPSSQSFYHNGQNLENIAENTLKNYPDTNVDNPICLVTQSAEESTSIEKEHMLERPIELSEDASIAEDVEMATSHSFMVFRINGRVGESIRAQRITRQLILIILAILSFSKATFHSKSEANNELLEERIRRFELLKECEIRRRTATDTVNKTSKKLNEQFEAVKNIFVKIKRIAASVKWSLLEADSLLTDGKATGYYFNGCQQCSADCKRRSSKMFKDSKNILKQMKERKGQRDVHFIEERLRDRDRAQLIMVSSKATSLWQSHCEPNMRNTVRGFSHWKRVYLKLVKTLEDVKNGLNEICTLNRVFADHLIWASAYNGKEWTEWTEFTCLTSNSWKRVWSIESEPHSNQCELRGGRYLMSRLSTATNEVDSIISENSRKRHPSKQSNLQTNTVKSPVKIISPFLKR